MKILLVSIASLLVGLGIGCYIGFRFVTNTSVQMLVESGESSDALAAASSAGVIGLLDAGQTQQAVQMLSHPIGRYYFTYASSTFTNEQRLKLRAMIEKLASTNQTVAARIGRTVQ